MSIFKDFTLIVASFNTPIVTEHLLKSFIYHHREDQYNIILMENSLDDETKKILTNNNIPYVSNPGMTHSESVDIALRLCKTKYALLLDTDVIFLQNVEKVLETFVLKKSTLMGEVSGSRGGYVLKNRVNPWFCLINIDDIRKHNIRFYDPVRINNTNSQGFYGNIPIQNINDGNRYDVFYDVGSTFFEDIQRKNLKIINAKGFEKYFTHYEGMSWRKNTNIDSIVNFANEVENRYVNDIEQYKSIDIKDKFVSDSNDVSYRKVLYVQNLFCPNQKHFEVNYKSLTSLIEYLNFYDHPIDLVVGGYVPHDEHFEKIKKLLNDNERVFLSHNIERFDKNYGKAYIVNDLVNRYCKDHKFFLTCDSDMQFTIESDDIFNRLIKLYFNSELFLKRNFGMCALQQIEANYHWENTFDKKSNIHGELIKWNSRGQGIAGGALFVSVDAWNEVGGYRKMGVYSGDDGYLLRDIQVSGFTAFVAENIKIIHPNPDDEEKYKKWKDEQMGKCSGNVIDDKNFEDIVKKSTEVFDE